MGVILTVETIEQRQELNHDINDGNTMFSLPKNGCSTKNAFGVRSKTCSSLNRQSQHRAKLDKKTKYSLGALASG